jgi:pentatricopeptide repeat domain-containing protein 3
VGRDYTAAHYKFHDDPYLIPYSNMSKRSYALSKEAGRKAAKFIREQHADLFQHQVAEPPIEVLFIMFYLYILIYVHSKNCYILSNQAFFPSPVFNEDSVLTQEDLMKYIDQGFLQEAIQIYNLLKAKSKGMNKIKSNL